MFSSNPLSSIVVRLTLLASLLVTAHSQRARGYLQGYKSAYIDSVDEGIVGFPYESTARNLEAGVCVPQPIETLSNGTQIFSKEKYMVLFLSEPQDRTSDVDLIALNDTASLAYNNSADCSRFRGSIRSAGNCSIVLRNVIFQKDALLVHCLNYSSNSIDGDIFIDTQNPPTSGICACLCPGDGGSTFLGPISPDGTCPCPCTGLRQDCNCRAPSNETLVDTWNALYRKASDTIGETVTISNVTEVQVLTNCSTSKITYNTTSVCLPDPSTKPPTNAPTKRPSKSPTRRPTRHPTHYPTRHPTEHPTRHPTNHPTRHPTNHPTRHPTHPPTNIPTPRPTPAPTPRPVPTIAEEVCTNNIFQTLCAALKVTDLLLLFQDPTATRTLFAPTDAAFAQINLDPLSISELAELLKLHIFPGRVRTYDDLQCNKIYNTLSETDKTQTICDPYPTEVENTFVSPLYKFQRGAGNKGSGFQLPLVERDYYIRSNGNILEVNRVILPGKMHPDEQPTVSPTRLFVYNPLYPTVSFKVTPAPTPAPTLPPTPAPTLPSTPPPTLPSTPPPTLPSTPPPTLPSTPPPTLPSTPPPTLHSTPPPTLPPTPAPTLPPTPPPTVPNPSPTTESPTNPPFTESPTADTTLEYSTTFPESPTGSPTRRTPTTTGPTSGFVFDFGFD